MTEDILFKKVAFRILEFLYFEKNEKKKYARQMRIATNGSSAYFSRVINKLEKLELITNDNIISRRHYYDLTEKGIQIAEMLIKIKNLLKEK